MHGAARYSVRVVLGTHCHNASAMTHGAARPMSGKSGFHPCTACNANIPQEDKDTLCVRCLGIQHATLALERDVACSICEAFQPRVKEACLGRAMRMSSMSSMAGPSAALGAPELLLRDLSKDPLLDIPDVQAACSRSPSPRVRRVKRSKQARDIMDFKAQMAQGSSGGWEEASQPVQEEDMLFIAASGEGASFSSDMQVPWTPPAKPRQSVFRTQVMASLPQQFPAFPDFMEEVLFSWDHPASSPSVLKHAIPLASLEGADKLGLAGFPLVDSTIVALVKAPSATRLSNTASVLTAYLDGVLREAPLPELVAMELHLLSSTLLQISGLQGQALGRSLASLIVARSQLWLSQAKVPDVDKAMLLDAPISPGNIIGPVVEEILQKSHRVHEASQQMATLLPPRSSSWGRWSRWRASQTRTVTRTVPVPTALLGDLRHRLQACTSAANNRAQPAGRGNAGRGQPTHQHHRRRFRSQRPKQTPQTALPQLKK
ncbi:UNVERIFIED_CONTAM: hypothetical protein FKN15_020411 [Acipenser sinensis]